MNNTNYYVKIV